MSPAIFLVSVVRLAFGVSGLATGWLRALLALRVLVCTGIGSRQSGSDRQLVYASCLLGCWWAGIGSGVPCHFFGVGSAAFLRLAWVFRN